LKNSAIGMADPGLSRWHWPATELSSGGNYSLGLFGPIPMFGPPGFGVFCLDQGDGPAASPDFMSAIGTLLLIAP
jgi:hypothetical protein